MPVYVLDLEMEKSCSKENPPYISRDYLKNLEIEAVSEICKKYNIPEERERYWKSRSLPARIEIVKGIKKRMLKEAHALYLSKLDNKEAELGVDGISLCFRHFPPIKLAVEAPNEYEAVEKIKRNKEGIEEWFGIEINEIYGVIGDCKIDEELHIAMVTENVSVVTEYLKKGSSNCSDVCKNLVKVLD